MASSYLLVLLSSDQLDEYYKQIMQTLDPEGFSQVPMHQYNSSTSTSDIFRADAIRRQSMNFYRRLNNFVRRKFGFYLTCRYYSFK